MTRLNINDLFEYIRDGDIEWEQELFELLTARFRYFVRRYIYDRDDAEDVVQKAMIAIAEKYKGCTIDCSFSSWAYKILRHKITDYIRSDSTQRGRTVRLENGPEQQTESNSQPLFMAKLERCFKRICHSNRMYARILNYHYLGYTANEICGTLDLTKTNFYTILSRARTMLEKCLENKD